MKPDPRDFGQRVRSALDASVAGLDAGTRIRLAAMRAAALEKQPARSRWTLFGSWAPAALAAGVIFAVVLAFNPSRQPNAGQLALQDADVMLELLNGAAPDETADPDFYVWLDVLMLDEEGLGNAG